KTQPNVEAKRSDGLEAKRSGLEAKRNVSQMHDKKNSVLFTESECLILSPSFKLLDESQVVLRAPRKDGVYSLDLKNIVPSGGHLVRGLPLKVFVNDHTCVACKKGKQHKASCKAKLDRIIRKPLELLHMDLFGPVSIESINKKRYCLVVTDDFSRFSWVFFLATKDETSEILCNLIIGLEKQLNHNVKIIRCDNGTEFKNYVMNEFCAKKGIKREFSVARTPQQNGVAERKNRTLIEAARTMLADSLLPIPFWAEAVNTACYVLNRVLVTKPQNKTPYELLIGKSPSISFMRPFGCPLTILNTLDSLGKFDGKSDEGYLLGYSTSSKAFRVYNKRTKRVEENLHINFLEDQPNVAGTGPNWMFDLDFLTNSMNYIPVSVENQVNVDAGTQDSYVAGSSGKDKGPTQEYILLPLQPHRTRIPVKDVVQDAQEQPSENASPDKGIQVSEDVFDKEGQHQMPEDEQVWQDELEMMVTQELVANAMNDESRQAFEEEKRRIASQKKAAQATSTNQLSTDRPFVSTDRSFVSTDRSNTPNVSAASTSTGANADESSFVYLGGKIPIDASTLPNADLPIDPNMPDLEDASDTLPNDGIFNGAYDDDEDVGAVADFNNMDNTIAVSPIPTLRIHKDHPKGQILGDPTSAVQTRGKIQKASSAQQALVSYIHKQNRTNHKDHQNCLFACFLSQEEPKTISQALKDESWVEAMQEELLQFKLQQVWILVDLPFGKKAIGTKWVFRNKRDERSIVVKNKAPGLRCMSINLQALLILLDTNKAYIGEVHIGKTLFIKKKKSDIMLVQVYVDDIIFGSTKKSMCTEFEDLKQQPDGIFISQDKYVADILKKFDFWSIRTVTAPIESNKPLVKDEDGEDVDVHVYKSMIGSLMYLTTSRPGIMFAVCACARFQVTLKASHLNAVNGFLDSDYRGARLNRKSTTGGCQFLGRRLISWQCKKQTIVANSTTEAEYVAAAHCCGQVLWIQNQMMDYGFNFMNTKIHIDNESTISVIKNPVAHSRTKHIEIRFHFIRDCYEKRLIEVIKIHTDSNVADLLTKGFDVTRFNFLVSKANGLGKDFPNPFMAGSLPKTIKQSNDPPLSRGYTLGSGEDSLELMELMANCTQIVYFVRKKNREICLELILLGTTLSTVSETAVLSTTEEGLQAISATIDGHEKLITEDSLRRHLKLYDAEGISSLSNEEIFEHLAHMGSKKTAWDQFSSNIATTLICLATSRKFNFSKFIFEAMITSLPSLSPQPTPPSPSPDPIQPTHEAEETASMPHDLPLNAVHSHGSAEGSVQQHDLMVLVTILNDRIDGLEKDLLQTKKTYSTALTKLVLRVKKLESKLKSGKERRKAKIEEEVHEKPSDETEVLVQEETPTEIIKEHGSGEKDCQDKGKAIMENLLLQRRLIQEHTCIEYRDAELARSGRRKKKSGIDWNDPSVLRYHALKNKPVSIAQARRNMITYLNNQGGYKERYFKKMSYNNIRPIFERKKEVGREDENPAPMLDLKRKLLELEEKHLQEEEQVTNKTRQLKETEERERNS
ncbi:putative ribonuclease H-like domain-containing protein, partial [Tanacetum coccineum]